MMLIFIRDIVGEGRAQLDLADESRTRAESSGAHDGVGGRAPGDFDRRRLAS
jgi:hypothetical protein